MARLDPLGVKSREASSFRDPSGFLFYHDDLILRQVNRSYRDNYDHLMDSRLYARLVDARLLIPHREIDRSHAASGDAYKILEPEVIPFISYPFEWSFTQLKQAALTTLDPKASFGLRDVAQGLQRLQHSIQQGQAYPY